MTPQQNAVRLQLYEDFELYGPAALKIRTKDAKIVPFLPNEAQRRLAAIVNKQKAETGKVRIIILKARQMGLSTWVGGRLFSRVSQRKARKALVVAHEAKSTAALFEMTKRFYDLCPDILKPHSKYSSRNELKFGVLDSGYAVATAGGDGIGRGETFTHLHASELAFWPKSSAAANFNGLLQAIPNSDDTEVYVESTANGVSGLYYELWQAACAGTNGFIPVFLPWFIDASYRDVVPKRFKRLPTEEKLARQHGLDDAQLQFRRRKIAEGSLEQFRQEYPATAEEAFLTTGRPVFNPDRIEQMVQEARAEFAPDLTAGLTWEPMTRKALEGSEWQDHPRGELWCYRPHDEQETYYIGADPAQGVGKDWSVAQVQDSRRRQVAIWRGNRIDPDFFATVLYHLGHFYNGAMIGCERNHHGLLTCRVLAVDHAYPNLYTETSYDKIADVETTHIGFLTTERSKPLILDKLRADVREGTAEIVDAATLTEMRSFITTPTGKMQAETGTNDDCVMALAICNHINAGSYTPITNQESWYVKTE